MLDYVVRGLAKYEHFRKRLNSYFMQWITKTIKIVWLHSITGLAEFRRCISVVGSSSEINL